MISGIFRQWQLDWHTNKLLFNLELLGVASSISAAILISFYPQVISLQIVFILWLIGSISLAVTSYMRSNAWPMALMVTYTVLNIVGLVNTL